MSADRPEVAGYARAAFNVLLDGFRARDGFLALQVRARVRVCVRVRTLRLGARRRGAGVAVPAAAA